MYPYNTPGAFVPHSAINLSVKPNEAPVLPGPTSLDLSMTDQIGATGSGAGGAGSTSGTASTVAATNSTPSSSSNTAAASSNFLSAVSSDQAAYGSGRAAAASSKDSSTQNAVPSPQILDLTRPVLT